MKTIQLIAEVNLSKTQVGTFTVIDTINLDRTERSLTESLFERNVDRRFWDVSVQYIGAMYLDIVQLTFLSSNLHHLSPLLPTSTSAKSAS